jgi:HEAT repeat protein/cyclophilin family peptidyl-prolyl cis-trans isomerase
MENSLTLQRLRWQEEITARKESSMNRITPIMIRSLVILILLAAAPTGSGAASRYTSLLKAREGKQKLTELARMEERRTIDLERLAQLARDRNPSIRLRCAEILGRIGDPAGVPLLEQLAGDPDETIAESAIFSLGLVGDESCVPPLRAVLSGTGLQKKNRALEALGATKQRETAPDIAAYLSNFNSALRSTAAFALYTLGDSTAARLCATAVFDPDPKVIAMVVHTMGRLGYNEYEKRIIELLEHEDMAVRMRSAEALGRLKSKRAINDLYTLTGDNDRMTALKAAEALTRIGDKKCSRALEELLETDDNYMKTIALEGLASIGRKQSYDLVVPLLQSGSLMVRLAALEAAGSTGKSDAREHLLSAYHNGNPLERMAALKGLGSASDKQDLDLLCSVLTREDDPLAREGAAAGLGAWEKNKELFESQGNGKRPVDALLAAGRGEDWVVASIAIESLAKIGSEETMNDLVTLYPKEGNRTDNDRKIAVLQAMQTLGKRKPVQKEAVPQLLSFLNEASRDPDPRVGEMACETAALYGGSLTPQPNGSWARGELPWGDPALPMGERRIRIATERGDIDILLYGDDAPNIVKSVITLAGKGFYDGLTFHRVVPGFVIQGGCPRGDGWGDAGYFLRSQFNMHRYDRGVVGMAHGGEDTPGSQFFITQTPQPHLNGRYTVIGRVTKGMDVVDRIERGDEFRIIVIE